ncbi:complement C1q-like protein 4 [Mercenaria mercenaria]|uniref:complement C1q-like protein 4 n=1 Tax=Mercenaria mercenaria TaxID=6596 RepID=UPI00234E7717|nr:complement C1q-like protein 4 [Mercenaria mercenaria]
MGIFAIFALVIVTSTFSKERYYSANGKNWEPRNEGDCSRFVYEYSILEKLILLETEHVKLRERIENLEKQRKSPSKVSVHVRLSKATPLSGTERVKYDMEISNIGGAYDSKNGHFTAPVPGIYLIHVQLCLGSSGQWMDLNIVKDGAVVGRVFSGDHSYHSCGSEALNIHLKKGDNIWIVRETGKSTSLNQDHGWNSFKALLVLED